MRPQIIAALAEQRRHQCACGAATEHSYSLCRKCHSRMAWRRKTTRPSRRATRRRTGHQARERARLLAQARSLRGTASKGAEN